MAVNRLLYSSQTCLITVGGYLKDTGSNQFFYQENDSAAVKTAKNVNNKGPWCPNGFTGGIASFLLPVQTASTDVTIPMEDVLVMGKLGSVKRLQKEVATSKCSVKAYLADMMEWYDGSTLRDAGVYSWTGVSEGVGQQTAKVILEGSATTASQWNADVDATANDPSAASLQLRSTAGDTQGPWPGITQKGSLAGENWVQNGDMSVTAGIAKQGLLEQLIFEAIGGFESRIECFNPDASSDKDGFSFFGILSSIAIDASKGAYPMLDLNWEGVGEVEFLHMGAKTVAGSSTAASGLGSGENAGTYYVNKCHPHTSDDVLVWGRERTFDTGGTGAIYAPGNATGLKSEDRLILIASNSNSYYQNDGVAGGGSYSGTDLYGDDPTNIDADLASASLQLGGIGEQGQTDTINSAKMSMDLPTETLTALGQVIEGISTTVRAGNVRFSKPPFKASITLDGNGLIMAAHEGYDSDGGIQEQVIPNEIQVGELHSVVDAVNAATTARSFSQSVGDVGASYNISVEGTDGSFYSTYQVDGGDSVPGSFDWNGNRDVINSNPA